MRIETRHQLAAAPSRGGDGDELQLERRVDSQLWARLGGREEPVWIVRCFPWTDPTRFISLRDEEENELFLVRDLRELGDASREALELALAEAGFVFEIEAVTECEEEVEIRRWEVRTGQGRRSFQTRRDEWPREMPGGGLLIRDVAGDLYRVRDPERLDPASRDRLWAFLD